MASATISISSSYCHIVHVVFNIKFTNTHTFRFLGIVIIIIIIIVVIIIVIIIVIIVIIIVIIVVITNIVIVVVAAWMAMATARFCARFINAPCAVVFVFVLGS